MLVSELAGSNLHPSACGATLLSQPATMGHLPYLAHCRFHAIQRGRTARAQHKSRESITHPVRCLDLRPWMQLFNMCTANPQRRIKCPTRHGCTPYIDRYTNMRGKS